MDYPVNTAEPLTMHIDLNACFAMVEQQANPFLRGVPVGVAANISEGGCVISPSYEAKRLGIKVGYRVRDARVIAPDIRIIPPDPDKYFYVHKQFVRIFKEYTPHVVPLSIDEAVLNFQGVLGMHQKTMIEIGHEIKRRMHDEIGDFITCNVGISTNRFLAKLAASLHKPDGLDVITHENLLATYDQVGLLDLCGINRRFLVRLKLDGGIYTPREFFEAPGWKLWKQVFKSVAGYQWYMRLRGWEVDNVCFGRKSYGQSYALHYFSDDEAELSKLMMKLCEKMARRLRRSGNYAMGIMAGCGYRGQPWFGAAKRFKAELYATGDFHERVMAILRARPPGQKVTHLMVSCFDLRPMSQLPQTLFELPSRKQWHIADALDKINNRYGEYAVHSAKMHGLDGQIIKRVPFHATTDTLSEIYDVDPSESSE